MEVNDIHPPDDYSHRFFIWHEWIQANGPLTAENVFDYFATSMFYDKQSNNQVLRMQTMHTGVPVVNEAEELRRFVGIEFALVHAQPPSFFIIQKRDRISRDEVKPLSAYFVMNNRIYQAPDLYTVLSNRLLTSLYSLQSSLDILRQHRPDYAPRTGFVWPVVDPSFSEDAKQPGQDEDSKAPPEDSPSEATELRKKASPALLSVKKQQNSALMYNAMLATAAHTRAAHAPGPVQKEVPALPVEASQASTVAQEPQRPVAVATAKASEVPSSVDHLPNKGQPGAGKKKRKRTGTSLANPGGNTT